MRLVDDDQVERLGRDVWVVRNRDRGIGHPSVQPRIVAVIDLLVAQRLEDTLDGGDRDARRVRHRPTSQAVDVVELGELPAVVGRLVVLELGHRLLGEVVAVDEEQDPIEAAVLEEPVGQRHRCVSLARAGGHLDETAVVALLGETPLDAVDRLDLGRAERLLVQCWQCADRAAPGRMLIVLALEDPRQGPGLREVEEASRTRLRIKAIGEMGLGAAGLEHKREAPILRERGQAHIRRQPLGVHRALPLHARQWRSFRLGLDHADGGLVDVEHVVHPPVAGFQRHLANGDALGGKEVHRLLVLHRPPGLAELLIDQHPCARLCR